MNYIRTILVLVLMTIFVSTFATATTLNPDRPIIVPTLTSQQPDPVQPGQYVEFRFRIDNFGQQAQDYTFELISDYPFSFDNPQDAIKNVRVGAGEAGSGGTVLFFRVRVDSNAVEGLNYPVRLKYHPQNRPQSFIVYEQPVRISSQPGLVQINEVVVHPQNPQVGSQFTLNIGVENIGGSFIENVRVRVDTQDSGLRPIGSSNEKTVRQIQGESTHLVGFDFFIDASTQVTVHQLPVTITYIDSSGSERTTSKTIGVAVGAEPSYIANLQNTEVLMPNQNGRITVSISNTGRADMNFAHLQIVESPDYIILNSPNSYLGNLISDDFETAQFTIFTRETNAESIPLLFTLTYRNSYYTEYVDEFELQLRLYDRQTAQEIGLIPQQGNSGFVFIVILVIGIVGFIYYRKRKKAKEMEDE